MTEETSRESNLGNQKFEFCRRLFAYLCGESLPKWNRKYGVNECNLVKLNLLTGVTLHVANRVMEIDPI